jgi:hypothetical protein
MNKFLQFLNSAKELVTKKPIQDSEFNSFMVMRILSMDDKILPSLSEIQPTMKFLSADRQKALLYHVLEKRPSFYVKFLSKKKNKKGNKNE